MNHSAERECNVCGCRCFARLDFPCLSPTVVPCSGTMCRVITPLPGKRVSGVLIRDKNPVRCTPEISLVTGGLEGITLDDGIWIFYKEGAILHEWTAKEWKEQYGKLPRKGSKQAVIIELTNGK